VSEKNATSEPEAMADMMSRHSDTKLRNMTLLRLILSWRVIIVSIICIG
jgi:hypothetical protein